MTSRRSITAVMLAAALLGVPSRRGRAERRRHAARLRGAGRTGSTGASPRPPSRGGSGRPRTMTRHGPMTRRHRSRGPRSIAGGPTAVRTAAPRCRRWRRCAARTPTPACAWSASTTPSRRDRSTTMTSAPRPPARVRGADRGGRGLVGAARGVPARGQRRATSIALLVDERGVIRFVHPGPSLFPSSRPEDCAGQCRLRAARAGHPRAASEARRRPPRPSRRDDRSGHDRRGPNRPQNRIDQPTKRLCPSRPTSSSASRRM